MLPGRWRRNPFPLLRFARWWEAWGTAAFFIAASIFIWWYVTETLETDSGRRWVNGTILVLYLAVGKAGCVILFAIPAVVSTLDGAYLLFFATPAARARTKAFAVGGPREGREPLGRWRVRDRDAAVVMRPGWKRPVACVVAGVVANGLGALGLYHGVGSGIWFLVFLGCGLLATGLAIAFSPRMWLYLTDEGFEGGGLLVRFGYRWSEVSAFGVRELHSVQHVAFGVSPEIQADEPGEHSRQMCDNYGLSPEALADLLNAWRLRCSPPAAPTYPGGNQRVGLRAPTFGRLPN